MYWVTSCNWMMAIHDTISPLLAMYSANHSANNLGVSGQGLPATEEVQFSF